MLKDSIAECLNMKQEEKEKKNMPDQRPTQTTAAIHITMHREQRITLSHIHTCAHTYTNLCIPLLTQSLHLLISIYTIATHSAVPCLSLRVMTQSLTQTHTTTRTIIKQTSTQSLSIAYLCTTSLVKSNQLEHALRAHKAASASQCQTACSHFSCSKSSSHRSFFVCPFVLKFSCFPQKSITVQGLINGDGLGLLASIGGHVVASLRC